MAVNTFGVVIADIKGQIQNISIRTDTSPSIADVQDSIEFAAAELETECAAAGISTQDLTTPTAATYLVLKKALIYKVAGELVIARNRGNSEDGAYYLARYDRILDTIRKQPQRVETDTQRGPDLAKLIDQSSEEYIGSQFAGSMTGKLISGGTL